MPALFEAAIETFRAERATLEVLGGRAMAFVNRELRHFNARAYLERDLVFA